MSVSRLKDYSLGAKLFRIWMGGRASLKLRAYHVLAA